MEVRHRRTTVLEDLTTDYLRKHLGEVFDRVQYAGKQYVVKRRGKEIGAIVPVDVFRQLQAAARANLGRFLDSRPDAAADLDDEQLAERVAEEVTAYRDGRK
jgi:prevent-host-death family protein